MSNPFEQYLNRSISNKVCQTHHIPYWIIERPSPNGLVRQEFCPDCQRLAIEQKRYETLNEGLMKAKLARTFKVFQNESIISSELERASFDTFEIGNTFDEKALAFAKRMTRHYYDGHDGNTVFMGVPGVGKSHLTVSMAKALNETFKIYSEPKSLIFIPVSRLISQIKASFNGQGSYTEDYAIRLMTEADFLFLDDLGKESSMSNKIKPANDWVQNILFSILDGRSKTILNTNFSRNQLLEIYDRALVDRIFKGSAQNRQILIWPANSMSRR